MKNKIIIAALGTAIIGTLILTGCSLFDKNKESTADQTGETITITVAVTDEEGNAVTDDEGNPVTEVEEVAVSEVPSESKNSASLMFGQKRDLSAVAKYNFSKKKVSDNKIKAADSKAYKAISSVTDDKKVYMGIEVLNKGVIGSVMFKAADSGNIAMSSDTGDIKTLIYIEGNFLSAYNVRALKGFMGQYDEKLHSEYIKEVEDSLALPKSDVFGAAEINSVEIDIGGELYTLEYSDKASVVTDSNGELCRIITADSDCIYHAYTTEIPDNTFDKPRNCKMMDKIDDVYD